MCQSKQEKYMKAAFNAGRKCHVLLEDELLSRSEKVMGLS